MDALAFEPFPVVNNAFTEAAALVDGSTTSSSSKRGGARRIVNLAPARAFSPDLSMLSLCLFSNHHLKLTSLFHKSPSRLLSTRARPSSQRFSSQSRYSSLRRRRPTSPRSPKSSPSSMPRLSHSTEHAGRL